MIARRQCSRIDECSAMTTYLYLYSIRGSCQVADSYCWCMLMYSKAQTNSLSTGVRPLPY